MQLTKINKIKELQDFINQNWKENHILSKNIKVFKFYYKKNSKFLNIYTTSYKKEVTSFLGFIPTSKFKNNSTHHKDICYLALWFKSDKANSLDVIKSFNYLINQKKWDAICVIGINQSVIKIYKKFDFKFSKMYHFYSIVKKKSSYKKEIINITKKVKFSINDIFSKKDQDYINNKYILNPFYHYKVFKLINKNEISILVARIVFFKELGFNIFRVIDLIGNYNSLIIFKNEINSLALKYNCKFFDFLIGGNISLRKFNKFYKKSNKKNFLPIYSEPIVNRYTEILLAYKLHKKNQMIVMYKGDGDQDRPNI